MAQNYTRQSTFADGDTITAALFNDEYNQIVNAFNYSSSSSTSTGHRHDGTSGQGGNIPQIGDLDFLNKIVVDSTNNRWGFFVEVSSAAVEQIRIQDGAIVPVTDNDIDLGTSSLEFKNLYIDGTANIDALIVDDSATIAALTVSGVSSLQGDVYLGNASADTIFVPGLFQANLVPENDSLWNLGSTSLYWANAYIDAITTTGNVIVGGTLAVTGATTLSSTLGVTGATTLSSTLGVTGATTLSSTLAVTGTSTLTGNVSTTNDLSVGGNLTVTGNATISGNLTFGDADTDSITLTADIASNITPDADDTYDLGTSTKEWRNLYIDGTANIDSLVADTADINAGTIDGTAIGSSSASTGAFTTITASSTLGVTGATTLSSTLGVTGATTLSSTLGVTGAATLSSDLTVNGNTTLGNAATDTVTITADVASNIIPSADSIYTLGDATNYWSHGYIDAVTTTGNVAIGGNLTVTGNATISGNLTFGDADTDTITIGADVASNITPDVDDTYDLGSSTKEWRNLYIDGTANIDSLVADTADINAGTIDNTTIGATTASTGNFSTLSIGGTAITSTATELNIVDGDTTATATTLADADRVVVNDGGTMVQVALTDFETYFETALDTLANVTTVGALNAGSITSGFGSIDNGSSAITTTGTITFGSLSDGTITITDIADEDDMTSDSATKLVTQQSVKAYIDATATALAIALG